MLCLNKDNKSNSYNFKEKNLNNKCKWLIRNTHSNQTTHLNNNLIIFNSKYLPNNNSNNNHINFNNRLKIINNKFTLLTKIIPNNNLLLFPNRMKDRNNTQTIVFKNPLKLLSRCLLNKIIRIHYPEYKITHLILNKILNPSFHFKLRKCRMA